MKPPILKLANRIFAGNLSVLYPGFRGRVFRISGPSGLWSLTWSRPSIARIGWDTAEVVRQAAYFNRNLPHVWT